MSQVPVRAYAGALVGTAVGDALGLPFEGLSRRRVRRWLADRPLRHRFVLGRGFLSDDTEHACLVAEALLESGGEPVAFERALAKKLRWWLLALPPAVGLGTLRGILKLWLGRAPESSGVFSAGNGAAMRAPMIGVWAARDPGLRAALVMASTRMTHSDPRALQGALVVAEAAALSATGAFADERPERIVSHLLRSVRDDELGFALESVVHDVHRPLDDIAAELGVEQGVSGYVVHTVPMVIACWLRHPHDFRSAVDEVVRLGGDTDTTAAMVGALVGAAVGPSGIPRDWVEGLSDWPRSRYWMLKLALCLAEQRPPEPLSWPLLAGRNALFSLAVLALAARRALPPY